MVLAFDGTPTSTCKIDDDDVRYRVRYHVGKRLKLQGRTETRGNQRDNSRIIGQQQHYHHHQQQQQPFWWRSTVARFVPLGWYKFSEGERPLVPLPGRNTIFVSLHIIFCFPGMRAWSTPLQSVRGVAACVVPEQDLRFLFLWHSNAHHNFRLGFHGPRNSPRPTRDACKAPRTARAGRQRDVP